MQTQSPDLKQSAVFRTIVSVVLNYSPQPIRWFVHDSWSLLDNPPSIVVLRNDAVKNLANSGVQSCGISRYDQSFPLCCFSCKVAYSHQVTAEGCEEVRGQRSLLRVRGIAFATADSRDSSHSEHSLGVENRFHVDVEGFQIAAHLGQAAYRLDGTV